jgi:hypothetical protein
MGATTAIDLSVPPTNVPGIEFGQTMVTDFIMNKTMQSPEHSGHNTMRKGLPNFSHQSSVTYRNVGNMTKKDF